MVLVGVFKGMLMLAVSIVYTIIMLASAKMIGSLQKKIADSKKRISWSSLFYYSNSSSVSSSFSAIRRSLQPEDVVSTVKKPSHDVRLHNNNNKSASVEWHGSNQTDVQQKRPTTGTITMRVSESMPTISLQSPS